MKLSEIITSACLNSQVVPSTNIGDIPGDIYDIALHKLKYDVLGTLNVDRTLDMALTSRVFQPQANKILLKRDPDVLPKPIASQMGFAANPLNDNLIPNELQKTKILYKSKFNHWQVASPDGGWVEWTTPPVAQYDNANPKNEFINHYDEIMKYLYMGYVFNQGVYLNWLNTDQPTVVFESADGYLVQAIYRQRYSNYATVLMRNINTNMRWMPYFVDSVLDEPSGLPHTLLDKSQFHSIDFKFIPWIYSVENGDNWMELEFKSTGNVPKRLTYPVPIYIDGDELVAPPKFHQYIMDCVAEQLAVLYNMSSFATIQDQKNQSYATLKRQNPNMIQPINTRLQIRNTLQSGQSRWFRFDGFNGG